MPKDEKSANADQTNGAEDDISGITTESAAEAYFGKAFATASLEEVDPIELRARCLKIWEAAVAKSPKIKGLFGTRIRNARIKALVEGLAKAKVAKAKAAKAAGQKADSDDLADRTVVDAFDHLVTARIFLETKCPQHPDGHTLIWWQGVFYRWTGPRWEELRADNIEHRIDLWLADECCFEQEQEFEDPVTGEIKTRTVRVKVNPGTAHVNEVVAALATETDRQVRTGIDTAFGWLGDTPEGQWLSVENGILNMDDRTLIPHTPRFFTLVSFRAEWNPEAAPVRRTAFGHYLDDLLIRGGHAAVEAANAIAKDHGGKRAPLPGEDQIQKLQEVVGYLLTSDTSLHKIFTIIGPRRCGKGTLMRTVSALMPGATTSLTTRKLQGEFGLQSMVGKTIALLADVRIDKHTNHGAVTETLLSVSGEDQMNVGRKNLVDWIGTLLIRFIIASNSTPQFRDQDGVLVSRMEFFECPNSFFGREDHGLFGKIMMDADVILRWAVEGHERLMKRKGRFALTHAHKRLSGQAHARMDPVGVAFGKEAGIFEVTGDAGHFVTNEDLWIAFRFWTNQNNVLGFSKDGLFKQLAKKDWPIRRANRSSVFNPNGPRGWGWAGIRWANGVVPAEYDRWREEAEADTDPAVGVEPEG